MSISILCATYLDPITGGIVEPCLHNLLDWDIMLLLSI